MDKYTGLLESFVRQSVDILGENLVGIYLHGSAVMGCFSSERSDIDLIVVTGEDISGETARRYMDMVVAHNARAPRKGIEMSIVRRDVCSPFVYPTPFLLHFSIAHLDWYSDDPDGYIEKMNGTDADLAAHFTVINHRGKTLCGEDISRVFAPVEREYYFDSILRDIENAAEDIRTDPVYIILNLCRVLAFGEDNLILSKQEGGEWGIKHLPPEYRPLVSSALSEYLTGVPMQSGGAQAEEFARFMLERIAGSR